MEGGIWRVAISLALVFGLALADTGGSPEGCRRLSASESILDLPETCSHVDVPAVGVGFAGVLTGDETALQRVTSIVVTNRDQYVAVLFYASWCSFSRTCLPNFNSVASMFPSIPHFTFEESVIRPSILSRYGVHGFPTIFLLHSSMRVRYHGSRSISSLTAFYTNVTGIKPTAVDSTNMSNRGAAAFVTNFTQQSSEQENCPFSWARSPEKLLEQDACLALASYFLMLRLLYYVVPKLISCLRHAWRRQIQFEKLTSLWDYSQAFLRQAEHGFRLLNPCKRSNLQEGATNAKAWALKSLASGR
ncbi:5'-adenylylsulfate reductase-like 3 [Platanthera guangdongensis]|uniref:5'-adenylylsulfate reductase-like 3 n=1 Tax=Platanthera guangdongensis TaxID=2320717 RepID=A0ABR2MSG2_9ASPA